jgi:transcriptional regulator with XRE-family HTH domain
MSTSLTQEQLRRLAFDAMPRKRNEPTGDFPALAEVARSYAGGLTLRQIELKTGISRTTISYLLRGRGVGIGTLTAFAAALGRPTNPLREAMGLEPIFPDPTAEGTETSHEAHLREVTPVANYIGVPPEEFAGDVRNAELMDAVKFVLELRLRRSDLQRWQKNNSRYLGLMEAIRLQQKARSKKPVRRPKPDAGEPS